MSEARQLLQSISEIARIVHEGKDPDDVLERIAFATCFNSPWQFSSIMMIDRETQRSTQIAHFTSRISERKRPESWDLGTSPTADVLRTGKPVVIEDALNDPRYLGYWSEAQIDRFRTVVVLPLRAADRLGRPIVISLQSLEKFHVSETMLEYLATVADLAAMALEKGQRLASERAVATRLESVLQLQRSVVAQAMKESSFEALIQLSQNHLPTPFIVANFASSRVYCSGFDKNDEMLQALNGPDWREIERLFQKGQSTRFTEKTPVELRTSRSPDAIRLLAEPIATGGQTIGGLAIVDRSPMPEDVLRAAESIWMALSIAVIRQHTLREADSAVMSRLLSDLLSGRADRLQVDKGLGPALSEQRHAIFAVRTHETALPQTLIWALRRKIEATDSRIFHGVVGNFLVFLVPEALSASVARERLEEQLLAESRRVAGQKVLLLASDRCLRLEEYCQMWQEMVRLSEWALERERYGRISSVDAGALAVLWGLLDFGAVEDFCNSALRSLRNHDRKATTPLLPTIHALLRHGGRLQPAADELGIHITTVRYRADRVRELFGLDLRNGETRFGLELALRLDALLSSTKGGADNG